MKKNFIIITVGVIGLILLVAGLLYSYYSNSKHENAGSLKKVESNGSSASDHFQVAPLTKEFVVDENTTANYGDKKVTLDSPEDLPVSTSFNNFAYDQTKGESISITGSCSDAYYAILIFRSKDDYKKNPELAATNSAFECPEDKKFTKGFALKDFNLISGEYYFFVADQGKTGSWYNPR